MSTALYRRYRPESFADVIGQDHVTGPLMQALRTGRVSHAYLFSGPRGCGKTTSARILARCLNCEQGPTPIPCGVCDSCVALARDGSGSVDVIEIDAASHGGVDDARDLRERASYGPALSRYKIYIIDEAHMVTPQGFNALLKIVEEPPDHVKFIFATTQPDKVIGTIRSRTHHYPFRLVPPLRLQDYLAELCVAEKVAVAPGALSFVVRAGGGSVRDSLSVLDQLIAGSGDEGLTYEGAAALLGFTEAELLDATIDGLATGDGGAVFRQVDKVIETGQDPRRFVEDLLERLRDLIVVAAVPDAASSILLGTPQDQIERIRRQSAEFGPGALSRSADIVNAGLTEMTGATAPRLQLELICARLLLPGASGESGYAARLDRLERRLEINGAPPPAGLGSASGPSSAAHLGAQAPRQQSAPQQSPQQLAPQQQAPQQSALQQQAPQQSSRQPAPQQPALQQQAPQQSSRRQRAPEQPAGLHGDQPVGAAGPVRDRPDQGPTPVRESEVVATPIPGGIDTDAIRRSWPDILAKIFTIRRFTWTFLSEHALVLDFDGRRLLLGIQTEGLSTQFHRGQHAEIVRQALSEVLGVEAVIEGIPTADWSRPPVSLTPAVAPSSAAPPDAPSAADAPSSAVPADALSSAHVPSVPDSRPAVVQQPVAAASPPAPDAPAVAPERPPTPRQRAAAVVAQERRTRDARSASSLADDSVVSADDEDIEQTGAVGQPVIARILGGTVIDERDQ